MLMGETSWYITTVFKMRWEYLSLYFSIKPQNPQKSIMQSKQTELFHNRWVLTKLHISAELVFNDSDGAALDRGDTWVQSGYPGLTKHLERLHLEKCLREFLFPKRMVPLQTMNIDSLPNKGKNDLLSRTMVTEINVFMLLRGLQARRK